MNEQEMKEMLTEASNVMKAAQAFNKKYKDKARIFSIRNGKIHLTNLAEDYAKALQLTIRFQPITDENGNVSDVFLQFDWDGTTFWYTEDLL